jgi:hypothetical protein
MMLYEACRLYQIERPKSRAEILRAEEQLGRMAESVTALWVRACRPIAACALSLRGYRQPPATAQWPARRA